MAHADISESSLKKLTVPQLKVLCKDRHIVGYGKLKKDGVIAKLLHWRQQQDVPPESSGAIDALPLKLSERNSTEEAQKLNMDDHDAPTRTVGSSPVAVAELVSKVVQAPFQKITGTSSSSLSALGAKIRGVTISENAVVRDSDTGIQQQGLTERTSEKATTPEGARNDASVGRNTGRTISSEATNLTPLLKRSSDDKDLGPDVTKIAKLDRAQRTGPAEKAMLPPLPNSATNNIGSHQAIVSDKIQAKDTKSSRRFKPLKPTLTPVSASSIASKSHIGTKITNVNASSSVISFRYLDFDASIFTTHLKPIGFPPSVSQRKRVSRLALILSDISFEDLMACALVSRLFRYSAYVAATNRLSRKFDGKRLQDILLRYPSNTTDFWPYLCYREEEASRRRIIYEKSFQGRALNGICNLKNELWSSPNHERQASVAVRFLLTKMFFCISIGHGVEDFARGTGRRLVLDAQEVIPDEIWKITFLSFASTKVFYVLEATCEVIGEVDTATPAGAAASSIANLRADWSHYITTRLVSTRRIEDNPQSLWDHVHWTNHEEYDKGISRHWLSSLEGNLGSAKLTIARRYVLACLVSNSVSGSWLTSNEMRQDFNGVPQKQVSREQKSQRVNLFLPAHHHVESVHFTASKGRALHPALAVVQTPAREYFIFKDNGMQVGCEEDGIAHIWVEVLSL